MTENEAIKVFKELLDVPCEMLVEYDSVTTEEQKKALVKIRVAEEMAIQSLEEIQQYRAIGTVERFEQLSKQFAPHNVDETSCHLRQCNKCDMYRKENEKYHSIGTIEEIKSFFNENRKAGYKHGYSDGYAKAIDEFAERLKEKWIETDDLNISSDFFEFVDEIAEEMRGAT